MYTYLKKFQQRFDGIRYVKEALKSRVSIDQAASFLGINDLKRQGDRIQGKTPFGDSKNNNSFALYPRTNSYYCFHYGKGGDIFSLVQELQDVDFMESLKILARQFDPSLVSQLEKKSENLDEHLEIRKQEKERYNKAAFYEMIYEWGKSLLFESIGAECLNYLVEARGYSPDLVQKMEWIYFPKDSEIKQYLIKHCPEQTSVINSLTLQGSFGDSFRLAFPYRDRLGVITGFIKRFHLNEGCRIPKGDNSAPGVRYDSNKGIRKNDLYGLNGLRGFNEKTVVIVEGCADVMFLKALGMKNVVATGQGLLSRKHLEGLKILGVEKIVLSLDNDPETESGEKNTHRSIQLLLEEDFRVFVVDPKSLGKSKDPDAFVRIRGIQAYQKLVSEAMSAARWKALHTLNYLQNKTSDHEREKYLDEAIDFSTTLTHPLDKEDFTEVFIEGGILSIEKLIKVKEEKNREKQNQKHAKEFLLKAEHYFREGKLSKLGKHIKQGLPSLQSEGNAEDLVPYSIEALMKDLSETREGLRLGYKALDDCITIPREAVTIVAGRPSHGKTTFLLNLLVNMVENTPGERFYFFSYEETCKQIALKLIKILSGFNGSLASLEEEMKRVKPLKAVMEVINKGKAVLNNWLSSGRLCLVDKSLYVDDLAKQILRASDQGNLGGVFIDYIQKIKIEGKFGTRQLELQKVSEKVLETAKASKAAVILGAQLGREKERRDKVRLDNLRECGDIEQDANLVLGILNKGMPDVTDGEDLVNEPVVDMLVSVLKNRNGGYVQNVALEFNRNKLRINDKTSPTGRLQEKHIF